MKSLCNDSYLTDFSVIGRGTFSTVYRGIVSEFGIECAIKMIDLSSFDTVHLERELNNMNQCNHENIVRIYHAFIENGSAFLILEYCRGGTLQNRLSISHHFDEKYAVKIVYSILSAISFLHSKNIIHRDIKAGNIFFLDETKESRVLLGDFGFSKQIDEHDGAISCAGTPEYMAPEVLTAFDNGVPYDKKCDIWSIGVLSFQMLMGYVPFQTKSLHTYLQKMMKRDYKYPKAGPSNDARSFIDACLNPNPSERPDANDLMSHCWITENL